MISIRWRLTLVLCIAMGLLLIITGLGVFVAMEKILHSRFDETLTAKARALITASEVDDGDLEIDLTIQDFAGFGKNGDDYFEIRRSDGRLVLRSPSLRNAGQATDRFPRFKPPGKNEIMILQDRLADGRPARFYLQAIHPKDDERKRFQDTYLIVASPTRAIQRELAILATVLAVAGASAIFLMIPLIRFGLGRGLRPLDRLSENIGKIHSTDLHQRLPSEELPAELQPVAHNLNRWLERLEESFERERRFSSHAAHELRTPLAEIRSIAELGARWPEEATPENCAEIIVVTSEMEALLSKLSLLARADANQQPVKVETLNLHDLVSALLGHFQKAALQRNLDVQCRINGEFIETDPILWSAIFNNLLGNAISHAPQGSIVKLEFSPTQVTISNPAPDLTAQDIPHLFERFWKKDQSRSGYGHSGLGLSIVQASASLLNAKCTGKLTNLGSFRVKVDFVV